MLENKLYKQIKVFHRSQGYLICIYSKQRSYYYFIWLGEPGLQLMKVFAALFNAIQLQTGEFYNSTMPPFQDHTKLYIGQRR